MRTVEEWIGKTDDAAIPPRVRLRVFERFKGRCFVCTRKLVAGFWDCDHVTALINGGEHREQNLVAVCKVPCHRAKTAEDVREKSTVRRKRAKHLGLRARKGRPMPGSRDSKFKRKLDGTVEIRE